VGNRRSAPSGEREASSSANDATPHRKKSVARHLASTFSRPGEAFSDLLADPRGHTLAALALLTVAVLYSLTEWFLYLQDYDPVPEPFLRIPTEHYYAWAALFGVPAIVGGWLLASGTTQLAARALGGEGRFEDVATALAWATAVSTLFTLVPDLVSSALGVYACWDPTGLTWVVFASGYLIAFCVLYTSAVRVVRGLRLSSSIVVALGGFVLYQGFILLFIR
jgi:hypothetical protein